METQTERIEEEIDFQDPEGFVPDFDDEAHETASNALTEQENAPEPTKTELSAEDKARTLGWTPKEEWKSNPDNWIDADTFLKRSEHVMPLLKKDRERLFKEVDTLKQQLTEFKEYHDKDRERVKKQEYERALADLREKQRSAVEDGDVDEWEKLEAEKEKLATPDTTDPDVPAQQTKEEIVEIGKKNLAEWKKENTWFGTDNDMTLYAEKVSDFVMAKNPIWKGNEMEFFDAVKEEVKVRFPEKFKNSRRDAPGTVAGGDKMGGTSSGQKYSFNDLPDEAKRECLSLERAGLPKTQFIAEYFGTEGGITIEGP